MKSPKTPWQELGRICDFAVSRLIAGIKCRKISERALVVQELSRFLQLEVGSP